MTPAVIAAVLDLSLHSSDAEHLQTAWSVHCLMLQLHVFAFERLAPIRVGRVAIRYR